MQLRFDNRLNTISNLLDNDSKGRCRHSVRRPHTRVTALHHKQNKRTQTSHQKRGVQTSLEVTKIEVQTVPVPHQSNVTH